MKHKIIVITACTTFCTCLITTFILMQLGLTTESNLKWYEFTLSLLTTISSYTIAWYLGYTHYMKAKKDKNGKPQQDK